MGLGQEGGGASAIAVLSGNTDAGLDLSYGRESVELYVRRDVLHAASGIFGLRPRGWKSRSQNGSMESSTSFFHRNRTVGLPLPGSRQRPDRIAARF